MRLAVLKQAEWLDRPRIEAYAAIFLGLAAVLSLVWVLLADGLIDRNGKPLGTDFANVYAAGVLAREGAAADAFFPHPHYAAQQEVFGRDGVPFYGWHYPPTFLFVAWALAALPYGAALATWLAATLGLYLRAMAPLVSGYGRAGWLLALGFPAVFVNLGHGQNAFLTAALLGGGVMLLPARPVLAGLCFGLLTYKPHLGLLIPVALAATGNWRAFAAAAGTALAAAAASCFAFGVESWSAFFTEARFTQEAVLEAGGTGWHKIQSLFAALRHWGAPLWLAYGAQAALAVTLGWLTARLWRGAAPYGIKAGALAAGAVMATPYALDYDLVVLALPIAWLAREGLRTGFAPWDKAILAAAFVMPLVTRPVAQLTTVPLGVVVPALLLWAIVRRSDLFASRSAGHAAAPAREAAS